MRTFLITLILALTVTMSGQNAFSPGGQVVRNKAAAGGGGGGVDNTLIVRYKFDEGSGTAVNDSSANNEDATSGGGATWVTGKSGSGSAMHFDGSDDFLDSDSTISIGANIATVALWVKATWPGGATTVELFELGPDSYTTTEANTFGFQADFATVLAPLTGDAFSRLFVTHTPDPTDATWVHLAVVFNNSTATGVIKVFYDGVEQTADTTSEAKTGTGNFAAATLNIGARNGGASRWFACDVDDFRIYSGELTTTEIEYVRDHPDE